MRRRAIAASLGSGTTRATAATVFLTNFATPCAQGDAQAPKGEISVQNVLEEINKGFKTSAHDDKVSDCPPPPHFCKHLQEDALQSFDSACHARECTCFFKSKCPRSCSSLVQVIHRIFERIDYKKDNKIDKEELEHTLRSLGYDPVRVNQYGISEVEQMIWEVDEDCDGCVSLEEFQQMFDRGRNDKTGNEPRKLFNLCQFMVLDRDGDGSVSPSPTSQSVRQPMLLALTTQHVVHIGFNGGMHGNDHAPIRSRHSEKTVEGIVTRPGAGNHAVRLPAAGEPFVTEGRA